ncbi:MAG: cysteine synthase family protein [Verrucomicrobia bacterium]|nr:MAG: cysteine synthase family protein [Verrucomicrobiota bacterium]
MTEQKTRKPNDLPDLSCLVEANAPTPLQPVRLDTDGPIIWCKLEYLNPSGSTKDRIASYILSKAWREGHIGPDSLICEASSGSTSIAMAMVCAQMGLRFIAVLPEGVSNERVKMIRAYGGEVRLSPKAEGISGCIERTHGIAEAEGAFLTRQFENQDNADAHRLGTAREVIAQIPGRSVDAIVSGVGTGGTLVGLHAGLRDAGCVVIPVLARPVHLEGRADYVHGCFGHSESCSFSSCVPGVMDNQSMIFDAAQHPDLLTIEVEEENALETTRRLIRCGFAVGASSGLNFAAAVEASRILEDAAKVVTVFPDRMERYFSTSLFAENPAS